MGRPLLLPVEKLREDEYTGCSSAVDLSLIEKIRPRLP
jgi:hypothetical protein